MNPKERFLAILKGEKAGFVPPLAHVSALTTVQLQKLTGCHMPEVHHDAEKLVTLLAANHEILGFDAVSFIINYFNEPAALGCRMNWGNERELPVYLSHPWVKIEDAVIPDDLLKREPIATSLKAVRIAKRKYGTVAVLGKVMGPFSMVQVMHGIENTMLDLISNPEQIKHFLRIATDILIRYGNAQFEAGADTLAIGEGGAGSNMLSPHMHEQFLLEVHRHLIQNLHGPTIMHICGDITSRLYLLAETGLTCFNFDWAIKPEAMKKLSLGKFRIMGNVNTSDLLRGKPEQIEKQVILALKAGVDIISPGCAVSPECPNVNFLAMSGAIKNYLQNNSAKFQ